MLTNHQQSELEKAIARAHRNGVRIVGGGVRKRDGARVLLVTSTSEANRLHLVAVAGGHLECDCRARVICAHRGLVHELLVAERAAYTALIQRAQAAAERIVRAHTPQASTTYSLTTPRLADDCAPISIFK